MEPQPNQTERKEIKTEVKEPEVLVVNTAAEASEAGKALLEPTNLKETLQSETERMKAALNLNRNQVRVLLSASLIKEAVPGIEKLLTDANEGKLKAADQIKLYDMMLKYSVGQVQSTEISGEDGGALKVQYMFSPSPEGKESAAEYLAQVRAKAQQDAITAEFKDERCERSELNESSAEHRRCSDNDISDVPD